MAARVLIEQLFLKNFLSFASLGLPLRALNVLIGPNSSGKSNLIEAFALLRSLPISAEASNNDLQGVLRRGGGAGEWCWEGKREYPAVLRMVLGKGLDHAIALGLLESAALIVNESVQANATPLVERSGRKTVFSSGRRKPQTENLDSSASVLALHRDPKLYPELARLADFYERIRIYRDWSFGRNTIFRQPQRADSRNDRLEEDFSNLGLVLSRLRRTPKVKASIVESLRHLHESITDFEVVIEGGSVQIFFHEGDFSIPATRLSDGTLRYLCLLTILCDPRPAASLICIEEPELGLHPDILPKLADLLTAASQRTQLIVTTHSDILVDALSEQPESVVVCEKHDGRSEMRRLSAKDLKPFLEKYRLGQLWLRGDLGGTRW